MARINTSYSSVIDLIVTNPFSLGELRGVNLEKVEKLRYF